MCMQSTNRDRFPSPQATSKTYLSFSRATLMTCGVALTWVLPSTLRAGELRDALTEITVQARKIDEKLGEIPISISVITATRIEEEHIRDMGDLTRVIPNFSLSSNGNPGGSILEMRGISSSGGASPVSVYLDDVEITSRSAGGPIGQPEPVFLDLQQVEVLRGPQGTLYGASAEAGVLRYQTAPVDLQSFTGSGMLELSDTDGGGANYRINSTLNAPLVDGRIGVRLAAQSEYDAGFIDRVSPNTANVVQHGINHNEKAAAKVAIEGKPTEELTLTAKVVYSRTNYGGSDTITMDLPRFQIDSYVPDNGSDTLIVPSLTIRYEGAWADVVSVSADTTRNAPFNFDATAFNSSYLGICVLNGGCGSPAILDLTGHLAGNTIGSLPSPGNDGYFERHISQELRVTSKPYATGERPLTWSGGVYFERTSLSPRDRESISGFNTVFSRLYGSGELGALFGGPLPDNVFYYGGFTETVQQLSEFADATFHISSAFSLSAGLRYLTARIHINEFGGGYFNGGVTEDALASRDHALTPKASLEYHPNTRTLLYLTASRGFRLGGPNGIQSALCNADLAGLGFSSAPAQYSHDSLWNYEFGAKSDAQDRISLSAAVFYDKWSALQQRIILPDCGGSFTTNVGAALSFGAETDIKAQISDGLALTLSAGYTHATLTGPVPAPFIRVGTRIEGVPDWSAATALEYKKRVVPRIEGILRMNYSYVGTSHGTLLPHTSDPSVISDYERPSYGVAAASLGGQWQNLEVTVFGKNLLGNSRAIQYPSLISAHGLVLRPRTIGVGVSGHF